MLLFRLNLKNKRVGYMKYYKSTMHFFSVDMYGWSATAIEYDSKDLFTGFYDKNQTPLFEGDIVLLNHSIEHKYCLGWFDETNTLPVYLLHGAELNLVSLDLDNYSKNDIEFYAFVRDNLDLLSILLK